jgi:hypothetical protein
MMVAVAECDGEAGGGGRARRLGTAASPGSDEAVRRGGWGAASVAGGARGEVADGGQR